jgi:hypothetical protein
MTAPWVPGEVITRREVLHGRLWLEHPVTVVDDDGTTFAVLLEPGSPFTFHDHPIGPHPWGAHRAWGGTTVLQVHRTGERYGAWKFFDETPAGPRFRYWYLNFESPIVRDDDGYDTDDHGLDLIVHPDGRREWKDVEHLHVQRAQGRIDLETVGAVLEAADRVVDLLDADDRWWSEYDDWTPEA